MSESEPASRSTCPLTWPQQRQNLILFALSIGMNYLAAPVLYIGITHAALCEKLKADTATSNLPATMFFAMAAMVTLIAWISPKVSSLKRNLTICYCCCAAILAALSLSLLLDLPDRVKIGMVILQGGVVGAVMPAATAYLWEAIGRGTDDARRGLAMGMAFGGGPLLAVIGSMCQTGLLGGQFFFWKLPGIAYPWNFVSLFAAGVPMMGVAIICGLYLIIPLPAQEPKRQPVSQVIGMLIGLPAMFLAIFFVFIADLPKDALAITDIPPAQVLPDVYVHDTYLRIEPALLRWAGYASGVLATAAFVYHFRSILNQRVLLLATLVTLLVYCGNMIPPNMNLYSAEALGDTPAKYAGIQNTLRFGFKMVAGIFYGWLLTKTNPRAGILATSFIFLLAPIWAIFVTGPWYLIAFGLYGAGELVGAYAPNYLVSASRKDDLRQTTSFMTMLMAPAAPVGYLFGSIVDFAKKNDWTALGMNSTALGFRLSFLVCALFILSGIVLALIALPKSPRVGAERG